jgi:hypothetical protein
MNNNTQFLASCYQNGWIKVNFEQNCTCVIIIITDDFHRFGPRKASNPLTVWKPIPSVRQSLGVHPSKLLLA